VAKTLAASQRRMERRERRRRTDTAGINPDSAEKLWGIRGAASEWLQLVGESRFRQVAEVRHFFCEVSRFLLKCVESLLKGVNSVLKWAESPLKCWEGRPRIMRGSGRLEWRGRRCPRCA